MKIFTKNLLGMALAGFILSACSQMATFEEADLMNEQAAAKSGFKLDPFNVVGNENARTYTATDCENFCIDPANPEYSMQTSSISNNSGPTTRVFNYTVHNTLTGFELAWNYSASNSAGRRLRITVSGAGFTSPITYTSGPVSTTGSGSNTFTFNASWAACGEVTIVASILDGDGNVIGSVTPVTTTYKLIGPCAGCEIDGNEFSGVANSCAQTGREAVYTYGSEEGVSYFKMQGGLTNFTGDNASVYINGILVVFDGTVTEGNSTWSTGTVNGFTVGQRTPGGSSNRNIRVEGGLGECSEVEVKIVWNSSNTGSTITGSWSVKDVGGIDLAPALAGLSCS